MNKAFNIPFLEFGFSWFRRKPKSLTIDKERYDDACVEICGLDTKKYTFNLLLLDFDLFWFRRKLRSLTIDNERDDDVNLDIRC